MRPAWLGLAVLTGCAPPAPPQIEAPQPAIRVAYPPRDVGQIALQPDGSLEMLIVVDVDNIDLTSPYVDGVELVDGQGHWHATVGDVEGYQASFVNDLVFSLADDRVTEGQVVRLTVSLQDNLHNDLDQYPEWQSSIEFTLIAAPEPVDTGAGDTGTPDTGS